MQAPPQFYQFGKTVSSSFVIYLKYNLPQTLKWGDKTNKLELMKQFMKSFVGNGFHLRIKEKGHTFRVHTIEIMQKTDDTCPVKEIPVGDYFLRLVATNQEGNDAAIVCNWTEELLQDLMNNYKDATDADASHITMCRDSITNDANRWLLIWGNNNEQKTNTIPYIS